MGAEKRQEVIFDDFSTGFDIRQSESVRLKRAPGRRLPHISGLQVEEDGSLSHTRNQFKIPWVDVVGYSGTPAKITQFVSDSYNRLLVVDDTGKLFGTTELDWDNETPTQWDYGYELFSSLTWSSLVDFNQTGRYDAVNARNRLYVVNSGKRMSYYDGIDVKYVGILPPRVPFGEQQDFSGWNEVDPSGYISATADTVTVTSMPLTSTAEIDDSPLSIQDVAATFELNISSSSDDGAKMWVVKYADGTTQGLGVEIVCSGSTFSVELREITTRVIPHLIGSITDLSYDTTYYLSLNRNGAQAELRVYSDSGFRIHVGSCSGVMKDTGEYDTVYAVQGMGEGSGTAAVSGTVSNLELADVTIIAGDMPAGTYTYKVTYGNDDFESMASRPFDLVVSADDKQAQIAGLPTATTAIGEEQQVTWRKIYRAFTASTEPGARGSEYLLLTKIDDNTTTEYDDNTPQSYLSTEIPYDRAIPPKGDILLFFKDTMFMAGVSETSQSYGIVETENLQNMLFYSEVAVPDYWPAENWIEIGDSTPIVALVPYNDYIMVIKTSSVFMLSMRGSTMVLRQVDNQLGATNPCHFASHVGGVAWTSPQGIVYYSGGGVNIIMEFNPDNPYECPDSDYNALAIHQGKLYYMSDELLRWDIRGGYWENTGITQTSAVGGVQSFNWGRAQSHIMAYVDWATGSQQLSVLFPAQFFSNGSAAGTTANTEYGKVKLTLPPVSAPAGKNLWLQEVWIDGSWNGTVDLRISSLGDYSDGYRGDAPQNGYGQFMDASYYGDNLFIQLQGNNSVDFEIRSVRVVYIVMDKRVRPHS